ncbi:thymidylate kinase [Arthrobacter sp. I2-34]|uniref:Thymidylate kinase n=1 Tax=Arthrobacter hankyongi TaxID=2904801 RepID=A0ABS9L9H9_9MICC|nr:thymidylate kinase [Arthrobacter hankyongi]MCG2623320.1 thymidylate kinase [Arthrobacter hankyongi]
MAAGAGRSGPLRIAILGIDGAGKTTAARRLAARFAGCGIRARFRRNGGGRRTLDIALRPFGTTAEALLGGCGLSRFETVLRGAALLRTLPGRPASGVEIHDRYLYCQFALNRARGCGTGRLLRILAKVVPAPDLVLYFEVDPGLALARVGRRGNDVESLATLRAFAAGYRSLPDFGSFHVIDANGSQQQIQDQIEAVLARTGFGRPGRGQVPC